LDILGNVNFVGTLTSNGTPFVSGGGLSNNGTNLFVLAPSNIGIHTQTPLAALHVASNVRIDGDLVLSKNIQFGGVYVTPGGTVTNAAQLILATSNIQGYSNNVWAGSNGTQFSIMSNTVNDSWRWLSGAASNEVARLTGNGRLGIGAVVPASILHLGSNGAANVMVTLCNTITGGMPAYMGLSNSGEIVLGTASNHGLVFLTSNVERMRVTSNGFVGVGTSNPTTMLHMYNGQLTMENTGYGVGASNVISFRHYNGSTAFPTPQVMSYLPGANMADLRLYTGSNTTQTLAMTISSSNIDVVGTITADSLLYRNRPSFYAQDWTSTGGVNSTLYWTDLRNSTVTSTTLTNGSNIRTTVAGFYHLEARAAYGDNWGFGGATANIVTLNFYTGSSTSVLIGTSYQNAKYTTVVYLPANTTFNVQEQYNGNTYHNKILAYTGYGDTSGVGYIALKLISF
jgi:hypothetical protein